MNQQTEKRKFTVSPNMIFHTIYSQAGSIEKAILECLMNAVDAKATKVEVNFNTNGIDYSIKDNGHGFRTKKEIEDCFEVFGFDHGSPEENQRTYGTFGIGRAQLWAFSQNSWKTNQFTLNVDIKNRGLDYELVESKKDKVKGCVIEGKFYEAQPLSTLQNTCRELIKLALYLPIEFVLDGKVVNKKCKDQKWDHETEKAYVKFNETGNLKIYNQGVYVREYSNFHFGKGGVIVSKTALTLNTARNDILLSKCQVWKEVRKFVEEKTSQEISKKEVLSDDQCQNLFYNFLANKIEFHDFKKKKVFADVKGKRVSLEQIMKYNVLSVSPKKGNQIGETILNKKIAFVFSPEILEWFDGSGEELTKTLNDLVKEKWSWNNLWIFKSFTDLSKDQDSKIEVIEPKQLTKKQKIQLEILEKIGHYVYYKVRYALHDGKKSENFMQRKINLANTELSFEAWTDGKSYVSFNSKFVAEHIEKGIKGMNQIILTMLHEYLHDIQTSDSHVHSFDFYENFHDMCFRQDSSDLMNINKECVRRLGELYVKAGLSIPKGYSRDEEIIKEKEAV